MAAWTKNEGLVFAVVMVLVASVVALHRLFTGRMSRNQRALFLWVIAGSAPVVIAIPLLDRAAQADPKSDEAKKLLAKVYADLGAPGLAK